MTGVEMLRQQAQSPAAHVMRRRSSPFVATLLSFVPGLGAAYNGQTSKAIVHFAIFASFFQMAVLTQGVHFFVLGVLGTWLFAAVDACRTAQLMRAGLSPDTEEDVIARRLYGNPLAWGVTLMIIGTVFLLHTLLGLQLPVKKFFVGGAEQNTQPPNSQAQPGPDNRGKGAAQKNDGGSPQKPENSPNGNKH